MIGDAVYFLVHNTRGHMYSCPTLTDVKFHQVGTDGFWWVYLDYSFVKFPINILSNGFIH